MWSIDPKDFLQPPAAAIARTVLSQASTGAIVLLHDGGGNRQHSVEALSAIIPKLKQQGYRFVTVSQLLQMQAEQKQPIADRKSQWTDIWAKLTSSEFHLRSFAFICG